MVKEKHMRLEVAGSIPSQRIFCMNILVQGALRYRLFYPVPKARAIGTTFGVPVQKTSTKGHMQPVPLDIFLVVKLASQINFAHVNTNHVVDSLGYNHAYLLKPICVLRACKFFFSY